jgi:ATP-dependent Lon protease
MAGNLSHEILPIIPLPLDSVLLPGITDSIPIQNRPDIPPLLTIVANRSKSTKATSSTVKIGCIPLCSPLLSPEGQRLVEDSDDRIRKTIKSLANPGQINVEKDLFLYGTVAKICGLQGRKRGDWKLVVEGLRRFRVERFTQFKPYVECEVTLLGEERKFIRKTQ